MKEFIKALMAHLELEGKKERGWIHEAATTECFSSWANIKIAAFAAAWPSSPDNPANWPEVYHVRSYGDMTKEQFEEYINASKS